MIGAVRHSIGMCDLDSKSGRGCVFPPTCVECRRCAVGARPVVVAALQFGNVVEGPCASFSCAALEPSPVVRTEGSVVARAKGQRALWGGRSKTTLHSRRFRSPTGRRRRLGMWGMGCASGVWLLVQCGSRFFACVASEVVMRLCITWGKCDLALDAIRSLERHEGLHELPACWQNREAHKIPATLATIRTTLLRVASSHKGRPILRCIGAGGRCGNAAVCERRDAMRGDLLSRFGARRMHRPA